MISFINRFHGHGSLRYVYQNGQAFRSRSITVRLVQNKHRKNSRIAVIVSKKISKSAVDRNRIRRRVYEYLRTQLSNFTDVFDIVVIVSSSDFAVVPYNEIILQISQILEQASVIKK
jgi:ribonuclease P protein component